MQPRTTASPWQTRLLLAALAALGVAAIATAAHTYNLLALPAEALAAVRWLAIAVLVAYAVVRRSLTTWILVAMVVGRGDRPRLPRRRGPLARARRQIFLRLIKTIIAPLLFATLVVGIAGHANLKQVGRMGVKALVYFEIVTTLALFIGLGGDQHQPRPASGSRLPPPMHQRERRRPARRPGRTSILHVFPENIAKSVAEGQVLQIVVFSVLFGIALAMLPEAQAPADAGLLPRASPRRCSSSRTSSCTSRPIGVGAAIAYTVGHMGLGILVNLFKLLATLYAALIAFLLLRAAAGGAVARVPLRRFVRGDRRAGARSRSPPPARKRRCRAPWRRWKRSACRGRSSPS